MNILVAIDDGHGMNTAGKRTPPIPELGGRVIHENEFNRAVADRLASKLKQSGMSILMVAPGDADTPLTARTDMANKAGATIYISIHYNAFDSIFNEPSKPDPDGYSIHVYTTDGANSGSKSYKLATCIREFLKGGTPQKDRGIITSNFHVLRETKMPAVLIENGFMDDKREAMRMIDPAYQEEVATEIAQGVCKFFGVTYKGTSGASGGGTASEYREVIANDYLALRSGPHITNQLIFRMQKGTRFKVLKNLGNWAEVEVPLRGFVNLYFTKEVK